MKMIRILVVLLFAMSALSAADMLQKTLPNGLRVVVKANSENNSVAFYALVHTGSENEGPYLGCGLSHYLEHVVSGGSTATHTESEYKEMEQRIGAIVNAYTTSEETAFYIQADKQFQDDALRMLAEHVTSCSFDSVEVAREKEVILKEIVMRSTPPMSQAFQRSQELTYPDSPKGIPVIGYPERFRTVAREQLMDYYNAKYMPNNVVFVACGNFDPETMMTNIETTFANWERSSVRYAEKIAQNPRVGEFLYNEEFDVPQQLTIVNTILPTSAFGDAPALSAALSILFGSRKAPIRYALVEEKHWANMVFAGVDVTADSPDGCIQTFISVQDSLHAGEILPFIDQQIAKYAKGGFKQADIDKLIRKTRSRMMLATPDADREANNIGRTMLHEGVPNSDQIDLDQMQKLTPEDLSAALHEYWLPKNRVVFNAIPRNAMLAATDKAAGVKVDARKITLSDNLTLLYRENREKPVVRGVLYFPLSTEYTTPDNVTAIEMMIDEVFSGSKNYAPLELSEWQEDHSAQIRANFDWTGSSVTFRCLRDDFPEMKKILVDAMSQPAFDETELKQDQQNAVANYRQSQGWGDDRHDEFVSTRLYPDQRRGNTRRADLMAQVTQTPESLRQLYTKHFHTDKAIVTLFGDLSEGEARKSAQELLDAIPRGAQTGERIPDRAVIGDSTYTQEYEFEACNVEIVTAGPGRNDSDHPVMQVIGLLLNGSRGSLFNATRGNAANLAYYAYADFDANRETGSLHVVSQTSAPNRDKLINALNAELDKLASSQPTREQLDLAIDENRKIVDSYLTDNQMPYMMTLTEARGQGYDYFLHNTEILKKVTPADVQRVAAKFFAKRTTFISQPNADVQRTVE
jgi:zinc protease